jgi:hypothetical protein
MNIIATVADGMTKAQAIPCTQDKLRLAVISSDPHSPELVRILAGTDKGVMTLGALLSALRYEPYLHARANRWVRQVELAP